MSAQRCPCTHQALHADMLTRSVYPCAAGSGGMGLSGNTRYLLSVPLLGPREGGGSGSAQRIGAVSMSVALLDPQLSDRRARRRWSAAFERHVPAIIHLWVVAYR